MARWDGMEQAATVAQLMGVDALGLISTIVQTAQTVRRNKEICQELVKEVQLIHDLLRMLQDPDMMRRAEIMHALNGLEGTLKEAYALVTSCRDCSAMKRFLMGWKQADQFRRIMKKIAKHLRFYPMISHADLIHRLEKIANGVALSTCSSQDTQDVLASSSTSHSNPEARDEGSLEITDELETEHVVSQPVDEEERHQAGKQDAVQTLSSRKSTSWLHDVLSSKKAVKGKARTIQHRAVELFTLAELVAATNNFSPDTIIGIVYLGTVYMGMLPDGREVAIKRMTTSQSYVEEFRAQVTVLSTLHHKHIVRLVGCCVVERKDWLLSEEHLLIFEYMKNGSLSDHLYGPPAAAAVASSSSSSPVTSSWKTRIEILLGVSRAIDYLHSYTEPPIIHRDIKPSNILLDSSWAPRLSGFGLAISYDEAGCDDYPFVCGTRGYIAPECFRIGNEKPARDVYSFGVVMMEVLTGRNPPFCLNEDEDNDDGTSSLFQTVRPIIEAGELWKVLDRRPAAEPTPWQLEAAELVARMAARCLQPQVDRPAMSHVVANLQAALELVSCEGKHGLGVTAASVETQVVIRAPRKAPGESPLGKALYEGLDEDSLPDPCERQLGEAPHDGFYEYSFLDPSESQLEKAPREGLDEDFFPDPREVVDEDSFPDPRESKLGKAPREELGEDSFPDPREGIDEESFPNPRKPTRKSST